MFRPDIQGLRALAVCLVVVAHAGVRHLAGGFVGVDVFFVISGFLIIGLLFAEAGRSGRVSILGFYARRARRVIPAATVVLVATVAASVVLLPFVRTLEVIKDALWASVFGANIRFAAVGTDYFAKGDPPSPVQHYWSLSVEEQFYLVIPILLLVIALLVRRSWGSEAEDAAAREHRLRMWAASILVLVSGASLAWSISYTSNSPTAAYFSTPARAWELGVGGVLAVLVWGRRIRLNRWVADVLGLLGLALIVWATLMFSGRTHFPGLAAGVPVLGALLLLAAGAGTDTGLVSRALGVRPVRLVGDWSYSIYLWHFPVLILAEHFGHAGRLRTLCAIALVFLLAGASYHLVEQPFRRGVRWQRPWFAVLLYPVGLAMVLTANLGVHLWVQHRLDEMANNPPIAVDQFPAASFSKDPAVALVQASVRAAHDGRPIPGHLRPALDRVRDSIAPLGDCDYRTGTTKLCPVGTPDADRTIVVLGDSHGRAWGPAVTRIGADHGYRVYQLVYSACPANLAVTGHACDRFNHWVLDQLKVIKPDLAIVVNNGYARPGFAEAQYSGLSRELEAVGAIVPKVAFVGNSPELRRTPGQCLSDFGADLGDCLIRPAAAQERMQQRFGRIAEQAGATYVDAMPWFCSEGECPSVIGREIPIRDRSHITAEYSATLGEPLARRLGLAR